MDAKTCGAAPADTVFAGQIRNRHTQWIDDVLSQKQEHFMASRALKIDPTRATVSTPESFLEPIIGEEEISGRAYELWREKGCPDGTDKEDWFQAENELKKRFEQGVRAA